MKFINYLLILILIFLIFTYYFFNEPFFVKNREFPNIPEQVLNRSEDEDLSTPKKEKLEDLVSILQEYIKKGSDTANQIPAWSLKVNSYTSYEECLEDFKVLKEDDFKVYIRQENIDEEIFFELLIGPNIDKTRLKEIQDQVKLVLNINGNIVPYKN